MPVDAVNCWRQVKREFRVIDDKPWRNFRIVDCDFARRGFVGVRDAIYRRHLGASIRGGNGNDGKLQI